MFPVDGLSPNPIVGNLEVPSRTTKREESFFGTTSIGSATAPKVETGIAAQTTMNIHVHHGTCLNVSSVIFFRVSATSQTSFLFEYPR